MSITVNQSILFLTFLFIPSIFSGNSTEDLDDLKYRVRFNPVEYNDTCIVNHPLSAQIEQIVRYYHLRLGFHGNVLIVQDGKPIFAKSIGYADPLKHKKLNNNSAFELASVSKQFTAYAIMMLNERGLLDYDDPIDNFLCALPYKGITIRHLLNHTSGVQNYMWLLEHKWKESRTPTNLEVVDFMAANEMYMNFKPGSRHAYSNTGYILLASIVEKVTNQSFKSFIEENIFEPLHMYNASVGPEEENSCLEGFHIYRRHYSRVGKTVHDDVFGDKGIYASIWDLYKWNKELNNPRLLDEESLQDAFEPVKINGTIINYGFGFRLKEDRLGRKAYHNGLWNGFRTSFIHNFDTNTTIVVLNHTNSKAKTNLVNIIEKIMRS